MFFKLAKITGDWLMGRRALSAGYRSLSMAPAIWNLDERPPLTLHMMELMEYDDILAIGLGVRDGILSHVEVEVEGGPPAIRDYVLDQWKRLWALASWKMLRHKITGYAGFELIYEKGDCNRPQICEVRDFAPRDIRPLIYASRVVGLSINNLRSRQNDPAVYKLPQESKIGLPSPKGLWLSHLARQGTFYGNTALRPSYAPWYEKWMRGGAVKLRQLRMVKDAWIGDVIKYPERKVINPDGTETGYREVAQNILDNRYSGSTIGVPSTRDASGNPEWEYIPPTTVQGATQIFEYTDKLDEAILNGVQTPREVIKAVEGGIGGVGGRSIPLIALFATLQREVDDLLRQVDDQVLRNLVRLGFHTEPKYKLRAKPLIETMTKMMGGGGNDPGKDAGGGRNYPDSGPDQYSPQPREPYKPFGGRSPIGADATEKSGVQFSDKISPLAYTRGRSASPMKAGKHGNLVGGVYYRPGEWIPGEAITHASAEEVLQLSDFREVDHPRDDDGKFTEVSGGGSKKQNFAQYLTSRGIKDPGLDHSRLSPNGSVSARSRNAMMQRYEADLAAYSQAQRDYQEAIDSGEIVDPSGKYYKRDKKAELDKATKEKIERLKRQADEFREYAAMGFRKKAHTKQAEVIEAEIEKLTSEARQLSDQGLRWITIGGRKDGDKNHKGGFPVQIDADGVIQKCGGPGALVGTHIDKVGSYFYRESLKRSKERDARDRVKYGVTEPKVGQRRTYAQYAEDAAKHFGISREEYDQIAEDVWGEKTRYVQEREEAKAAARKATGLDSRKISQLENKGLDSSTAKQFDTIGRELASEYPVLGWGGGYNADDVYNSREVDYGEKLWELIREGKQEVPQRNSDEFHNEVFDFIEYHQEAAKNYQPPEWLNDVEF